VRVKNFGCLSTDNSFADYYIKDVEDVVIFLDELKDEMRMRCMGCMR